MLYYPACPESNANLTSLSSGEYDNTLTSIVSLSVGLIPTLAKRIALV